MAMNTQKIVVGGIAAGLVIFALDFVTNALLFGDRWAAEMEALNPTLAANMESTGAMVGFAVVDLLMGIVLVWLYAAIRPNFGPGPKTAMIAGLYFWFVTGMVWAVLANMGMFSWGMFAIGGVTGLVTSLAAAYVGGMMYKESTAAVTPAM